MSRTLADASEIAALMGSRICHDLISPLGAIGNGMELLELSGIEGPEIDLIRAATEDANRRLRFFRVAFGRASDGQVLDAAQIAELITPPDGARGLHIHWLAPGEVPRDSVRRCFLALMCMESAMPWGGECLVRRAGDGWHVAGAAQRMRPLPDLWRLLTDGPDAATTPEPADLHFALLALDLARDGRRARLDHGADEISLSF